MQADDLARPARAKIFFSLQQLAATRGARNRPNDTIHALRQPFSILQNLPAKNQNPS